MPPELQTLAHWSGGCKVGGLRGSRRATLARARVSEQPEDFLVFGKAAALVFGEDEFTVGDDIENAVVAADEFGFDLQFLLQGGRQTGGLRQVVSTAAVFDRDLHILPTTLPGWAGACQNFFAQKYSPVTFPERFLRVVGRWFRGTSTEP